MNGTEELPEEEALHRLLAEAFDPTGADVPMVNLVPGAVGGFERHRRRTRVLGGVASVAVLGVAAAAYAASPDPGARTAVTPGSKPTPAAPAYDIFAHPGTPDQECRGNWMDTGVAPAQARETCLLTLPLLRELLPSTTVIATHIARTDTDAAFIEAGLDEVLKKGPVGVPHPAIAAEWTRVMKDPDDKNNLVNTGEYSIRNPDGSTFGMGLTYTPHGPNQDPNSTCVDGKSAGSKVPCWNVTLANGTKATFVSYSHDGGNFEAYVMDKTGGQFTFSVNWETGRYVIPSGPGKDYFDFATGTKYPGATPDSGKLTTEQFSDLLRSQGFADIEQKYLDHVTKH